MQQSLFWSSCIGREGRTGWCSESSWASLALIMPFKRHKNITSCCGSKTKVTFFASKRHSELRRGCRQVDTCGSSVGLTQPLASRQSRTWRGCHADMWHLQGGGGSGTHTPWSPLHHFLLLFFCLRTRKDGGLTACPPTPSTGFCSCHPPHAGLLKNPFGRVSKEDLIWQEAAV